MARLPYDVSRCVNDQCPLRAGCLRFTDPGHPTHQVFMHFAPEPDGTCQAYEPAEAEVEEVES